MPRVDRRMYSIDGVSDIWEIWFSTKEGFYVKGLPEKIWVPRYGSPTPPKFHSIGDLHSALAMSLQDYHEAGKSSKKVLIVELTLGSDLRMKREERDGVFHCWSGKRIPEMSDRLFAASNPSGGTFPNAGLSLDYEIAWLVTNNGGKIHADYKGSVGGEYRGRNPEKEILIDYTPEREQFLKDAKQTIVSLVDMLVKFFSSDMEQLALAMDNHISGNLLMAPSQKTIE